MPKIIYKDYIQQLRKRYYKDITGQESLLKIISETEVAEQVYNSNAIENSTLTLDETEKILLKIDLDRYISQRELFEAKNLAEVVEFTNENAKKHELDIDMILQLHKMLITGIRDDIAGRFRQAGEFVKVANHIAPRPDEIEDIMSKMLVEYNSSTNLSIVERIARLHLNFENIHPFVDGNGRIGRVLNNYLLIREGYVPINIKHIDRQSYYEAFKEFDLANDTSVMEDIVAKAITNSYHKRLAYLEGKKIVTLSEYSKIMNISQSNLLNKAKRQTVEAFLVKGIWKITLD